MTYFCTLNHLCHIWSKGDHQTECNFTFKDYVFEGCCNFNCPFPREIVYDKLGERDD